MIKDNLKSGGKIRVVNPEFFTGPVKIKEFSNTISAQEQKIYHVNFKNGAKTKIHFHDGGQLLIVTRGKGSLEFFKKFGNGKSKFKIKSIIKLSLKEGDVAYIPSKYFHAHGSIYKRQIFSHFAINSFPKKNKEPTTWWFESDFKNKVTGQIK